MRDVFAEWHRGVEVNVGAVDPPVGLREQPIGDEVARGAVARTKEGGTPSDAGFGVGIEAGLMCLHGTDAWLSCQVCAVAAGGGQLALGLGGAFELPDDVRALVPSGVRLRDALQRCRGADGPERHRTSVRRTP